MMPNPIVFAGAEAPSHDISLTNVYTGETIALVYQKVRGKDGVEIASPIQAIPISDPAKTFTIRKKEWTGGRGKVLHQDDPTGYFDAHNMWTMSQKLFPAPRAKFATGYRTAEMAEPGNAPLQRLDPTTTKYLARSFVASASTNRTAIHVWTHSVGKPGALTVALYSNDTDKPGTAIQSATVAYSAANQYGPTPVAITSQALVATTTYWIVAYCASTDNPSNYWEVTGDPSATAATRKKSANGTAWAEAPAGIHYRITDAHISRQWRMFNFYGADYFFSQLDAETAGSLYINGDRGKLTGATATVLTDTKSGTYADGGWTADMWIGAKVRIIAGTGAGQVRTISDNDTTTLTVSVAFDKTPDNTSEFIIYDTAIMSPVATTGITALSGKPMVVDRVAYFPQGTAVNIRKMGLDYTADSCHKFTDEGTNKADMLELFNDPSVGLRVYAANRDAATVRVAATAAYGSSMSFGTAKSIGSSSSSITSLLAADAVYAFKEDGLFKCVNNRWEQQTTGQEKYPSIYNGLAAIFSNDQLWYGWSHSIMRRVSNSTQDMLAYKGGNSGLPSDRTGPISSAAALGGWLIFAVDGLQSNKSSLIVWNGYGWHEIYIAPSTGHRIRNLYTQSGPEARNKLWFDVNGDLMYIPFPLYTVNPENDTGLEYNHFADIISATFDGDARELYKTLEAIRVTGEDIMWDYNRKGSSIADNLNRGYFSVYYQVNTSVGSNNWIGPFSGRNGFWDYSIKAGNITQFRIKLELITSYATLLGKILEVSMPGMIFTPAVYQWTTTYVLDGFRASDKNGDPDYDPDTVIAFLRNAHASGAPLTMRTNVSETDNTRVITSAPAYTETKRRSEDGKSKWAGSLSIALREMDYENLDKRRFI